jgi:thiol-disulfide isomerase/thioredoxin
MTAAVAVSLLMRHRPATRRRVLDAAANAGVAFLLAWKLSPLITSPAAVFGNPITLLYMPGGTAGAIIGFMVAAGMTFLTLHRRRRNPAVVGVPLLAIAGGAVILYGTVGIAFSVITASHGGEQRFSYDRAVLETEVPVLSGIGRQSPQSEEQRRTSPGGEVDTGTSTLRSAITAADGRPVVLNFWATWCGPCRAENPVKKAAYREWQGDARFIGVNLTTSEGGRATVAAYMREHELPFPVYLDTRGRLQYAFGVRGTPTTLVLDGDGVVVDRRYGPMTRGWIDGAIRGARRE